LVEKLDNNLEYSTEYDWDIRLVDKKGNYWAQSSVVRKESTMVAPSVVWTVSQSVGMMVSRSVATRDKRSVVEKERNSAESLEKSKAVPSDSPLVEKTAKKSVEQSGNQRVGQSVGNWGNLMVVLSAVQWVFLSAV
jgi:hypothetical protein